MNDRKLVMKALLPVTDFLNKCYPCGCDRGAASHPDDECPGEIHEAEEVIRIVLEAVAADIWWEGADAVDEEGRMTTRHCPYEEEPRP